MTMSLPTAFKPQFEVDLLEQMEYLDREAGEIVADRFFEAMKQSIAFLAEFPHVGTRCRFKNPRLTGLRAWPMTGFRSWLIFFRQTEEGLEFIRLLHGRRDWLTLLNADEGNT